MIKISSSEMPHIEHTVMKFSGGEMNVKIGNHTEEMYCTIHADLRSADDIMELLLVTDALRRLHYKHINLTMPYIPYARQDRVMTYGESLSLKVFTDLINAQNYEFVNVWDAHSPVALALLDRAIETPASNFLMGVVKHSADNIVLVAPDAGATKRVLECAKLYKLGFMQATKHRNVYTGEITSTELQGVVVHDKRYVIVDDICDGGRTFVELAKEFGGAKVDLYVTHGIFSKGLGVFDGLIQNIYCANPWQMLTHSKVKLHKV